VFGRLPVEAGRDYHFRGQNIFLNRCDRHSRMSISPPFPEKSLVTKDNLSNQQCHKSQMTREMLNVANVLGYLLAKHWQSCNANVTKEPSRPSVTQSSG
jgi:hypothetical protein